MLARKPGGTSVDSQPSLTAQRADGRTGLNLLVEETTRQFAVCNSCRYCEGLCAVFPALERRTVLEAADVSQLANLCHDCRACYDACMYTAPHEFAINLPVALTAVRLENYRRFVWPTRVPRLLAGRTGMFSGVLAAAALLIGIAVSNVGWSGLVASHETAASPYQLVPYAILVGLMAAALLFSVVVSVDAGRRYWAATGRTASAPGSGSIAKAVWEALILRYLRGGGGKCYYPQDDQPSDARRRLHLLVVGGFGLCVVSTIAAAIQQDIAGEQPPYPWLSVPVISGTIGGIGLLIGCGGLLTLKARSSGVTSVAQMTVKDYGLLTALAFLALSGLAALLTRDTAAFGIVLLIHLAAVILAFASAPYSKLIHAVFRLTALIRDHAERA
jgi:citrate/tricarballylate utilization protein